MAKRFVLSNQTEPKEKHLTEMHRCSGLCEGKACKSFGSAVNAKKHMKTDNDQSKIVETKKRIFSIQINTGIYLPQIIDFHFFSLRANTVRRLKIYQVLISVIWHNLCFSRASKQNITSNTRWNDWNDFWMEPSHDKNTYVLQLAALFTVSQCLRGVRPGTQCNCYAM